jgi:DNA-binding HxlR family transcriptional regulator
MIRRRYKSILDYAIVDIFDTEHSCLRYHEIEQEISLYCKVSSATLSLHLIRLVERNVLARRVDDNGHTFYSLTKRFKGSLDIQKKHYPTNYIEKTLSLHDFGEFNGHSFHRMRESTRKFYTEKIQKIIDEGSLGQFFENGQDKNTQDAILRMFSELVSGRLKHDVV